ncbi:MAG: type VI secretion system accessory protein TagJ [Planctomycetota bacterium]|nr:type VI secretion system accessory protein TagJ [Planctomycetota bacterium]
MLTDVDDLLEQGRFDDAVAALEARIRAEPTNVRLREHLFQTLSLVGQWSRAGQLLGSIGTLNAKMVPTTLAYRGLVEAELIRREVFAGRTTPMVIGEPEPWMAEWIQSVGLAARGNAAAAAELRDRALDASPPTPFERAGERFDAFLDADTRLGPMLEIVLDGKYSWLPICRVRSLDVPAPETLADLVWAPVSLTLITGGAVNGYIPVRYPGTETSGERDLVMSRTTQFDEGSDGEHRGLGQRVFLTGRDEIALLEAGQMTFAEDAG